MGTYEVAAMDLEVPPSPLLRNQDEIEHTAYILG